MAKSTNLFRYFESQPEVIRTVVMMYVKYPLSSRNVEELLDERGIDICHQTVRRSCKLIENRKRRPRRKESRCIRST